MPSVVVQSPFNPAAQFRVTSRNLPPTLDFYHGRVLVLHLTYNGRQQLPIVNWVFTGDIHRHNTIAAYRDLVRVAFDMAAGFTEAQARSLTDIAHHIGAMGLNTRISDD